MENKKGHYSHYKTWKLNFFVSAKFCILFQCQSKDLLPVVVQIFSFYALLRCGWVTTHNQYNKRVSEAIKKTPRNCLPWFSILQCNNDIVTMAFQKKLGTSICILTSYQNKQRTYLDVAPYSVSFLQWHLICWFLFTCNPVIYTYFIYSTPGQTFGHLIKKLGLPIQLQKAS